MLITAISDLHGDLPRGADAIPDGELLVVAGDIAPDFRDRSHQRAWFETPTFEAWLEEMEKRFPLGVVLIPGNHDFALERGWQPRWVVRPRIFYGVDQMFTIDGLRFFLTPWCTNLPMWAFNATEEQIREKLLYAPADIDVLVTHAPPAGLRDQLTNGMHVGSEAIRDYVAHPRGLTKNALVICGHIHESHGVTMANGKLVVNASRCDERYNPINQGISIGI